jgi:hypothetical protein
MSPALCQAALGTKLPRPDYPCLEPPTRARPTEEDELLHFPPLGMNNYESIQNRRRLVQEQSKKLTSAVSDSLADRSCDLTVRSFDLPKIKSNYQPVD